MYGASAQLSLIFTHTQALLGRLSELDDAGARLAARRDAVAGAALDALDDYSAVLARVLPAGYPRSAHHHQVQPEPRGLPGGKGVDFTVHGTGQGAWDYELRTREIQHL